MSIDTLCEIISTCPVLAEGLADDYCKGRQYACEYYKFYQFMTAYQKQQARQLKAEFEGYRRRKNEPNDRHN